MYFGDYFMKKMLFMVLFGVIAAICELSAFERAGIFVPPEGIEGESTIAHESHDSIKN